MIRLAALISIAALGCNKNGQADDSPPGAGRTIAATADAAPTPAPTPKPAVPERVACKVDGDCMSSCGQGAVSTAWWKTAFPGDEGCEDGCADADAAPPRCEAGRCVAYDHGGARRGECTDRTDTPVEAVGPAHFCDADADCATTCALGAVNKRWYEAHPRADCRGGCTAAGVEAPRCEAHLCVAYRKTPKTGDKPVRDETCTRKSIWH